MERAPAALPAAAAAHREQRFGNIDLDMAARAAAMMPVSHNQLSFRCVLDIS